MKTKMEIKQHLLFNNYYFAVAHVEGLNELAL